MYAQGFTILLVKYSSVSLCFLFNNRLNAKYFILLCLICEMSSIVKTELSFYALRFYMSVSENSITTVKTTQRN